MTDQVASLVAKYDDQVSAGAKAAADALNKVGDAAEYSEQKVTRAAKSGEQLTRQYDEQARLAAKVDTITAKYARDLDSLEKSELDAAEKARLRTNIMAQQEAAIQRATAAHERYVAGIRALNASASSNDNMNRAMVTASAAQAAAMDASTASAKRFNTILQQGGYQVSDFANQVATGTNVATAFGMQFGQLAAAFGPIGAGLGALVNVGGVAIGVLSKMGDASKKSTEDIHMFSDMLDIFKGRAVEAGASVEDLTSTYRGLSAELRAISKLALQADMDALNKKLATGIKDNWYSIWRQATADTKAGDDAVNLPIFDAMGKMAKDHDIAAFLGRLQQLNGKGALKLMGDADVQELLKAGEALRVAEARMADLEGRATPAQKALLGYAEAAKEAAKAASELATAQARAGASLFIQEKDLDAKIKALKGGEDAMKAYGEEQVRTAARSKAYDAAVHSGMETLDATAEANRVAAKAVEAYRLEQQRSESQKASSKAESQAERDAKAYAKVTGELDRNIAEQQRLAGVVGQGVEAQREANTQTKIAEEMAKAHAAAGSEEAKVIEKKVRELEKWKNAVADAKVLEASKTQLAYSQKELSLMGQAEPIRERALKSFQIQQQAAELAKTTTAENVAEWVRLQEQIADTQALVKFQKQVESVSDNIAGDVATAMFEGFTGQADSIVDWFKSLMKRLAIEALKANIVLPITQQIVGAVPSLFGIQGGGSAANQNGGGLLSNGNLLSLGSKFLPTGGINAAIDSFGYSALGIGTIGSWAMAAPASVTAATAIPITGAASLNAATGVAAAGNTAVANTLYAGTASGAPGAGIAGGLSGFLGAGAAGLGGGMLGGALGTATNSKAVGGLSGAALGAGASYLGGSLLGIGAMTGPIGLGIAAAVGLITGLLGTQKATVGKTASADVTINAGGKSATYGNILTDNEGDPAAGQALGTALSGIYSIAAMGGGTLTKDFGIGQTAKNGLYVAGSVPYKEFGDDVSGLLRYTLLEQGGLKDGGANTIKALQNSKAKDWEEAAKDIGLGASIDAGNTALKEMVKTLSGVTDAAKKATAESFKPMFEELERAKKLGIDGAYKDLATDQLKAYLDQLRNPPDFTQVQTDMAALTGQFQAARDAYAQLNPQMVTYVDQIEKETKARMARNLTDSLDQQIRQVGGRDYINQISGYIQALDANARSLIAVGEPATKAQELYNASLTSLLKTLTTDQLGDVANTFGGDIATLASAISAAATATEQATQFENLFSQIRQQNIQEDISLLNEQINTAKSAQSQWQNLLTSIGNFRGSLLTGDLSPLSPKAKLDEAMSQFNAAVSAANGGDVTAAGQVQSLAQAALQAAKSYYASSEDYARIFDQVQSGLGGVESVASRQVSLQASQLSTLQASLATQQSMLDALNKTSQTDVNSVLAGLNSGNLADLVRWGQRQGSDVLMQVLQTADTKLGQAGNPYRYKANAGIMSIADHMSTQDYLDVGKTIGFTGTIDQINPWIVAYSKQDAFEAAVKAWGASHGYQDGGIISNGIYGVDSVIARMAGGGAVQLAGGEYVMPADQTAMYRPALDAMRAGTWGAANDRWGGNVLPFRGGQSGGSSNADQGWKAVVSELQAMNRDQVDLGKAMVTELAQSRRNEAALLEENRRLRQEFSDARGKQQPRAAYKG